MSKNAEQPVFKRPNSKFWQIRFVTTDGREIRRSSGTEDFKEATKLYQMLKSGNGLTYQSAVADFFEKRKDLKPKTVKCYMTSDKILFPYFGQMMLAQITDADINKYVSDRMGKVKPGTIRNDLAFLASVFRLHKIKSNPARNYDKEELPRPEHRIRWLRPDQEAALEKAINDPQRWLIALIGIDAGLRKSEILNLRVHQVHMKQSYILLEGPGTKNGKGRIVPLSARLLLKLRAHFDAHKNLAPGDPLFVSPKTKRPMSGVRPWWPRALAVAKIEGFTFHDTRHHFASRYVQRGGRTETLQKFLGHSSGAMTERYAHLTGADAMAEFRRIERVKK